MDARDKLLRTPLHLSCLRGHATITKMLKDSNADPFERDCSGRTALHFACCTGSAVAAIEQIVTLCSDSTDLVHMKDHTGRTPLHYAVFNNCMHQTKVIQKLLQLGSNINAIDQDKKSPLHFAAEAGKASVIPLLIQNGASTGLKDYRKKTPLDLAATDHVRELIIVYSPHEGVHKPSEEDINNLGIEGNTMKIKKVVGMPRPDYYEPFEHAQPKPKRKVINK